MRKRPCRAWTAAGLPHNLTGQPDASFSRIYSCGADLAIPLAPASDDLAALTAPTASSGETTLAQAKEQSIGTKDLMAVLDGLKWHNDNLKVIGTNQPNAANVYKVLFGPGKRKSGSG